MLSWKNSRIVFVLVFLELSVSVCSDVSKSGQSKPHIGDIKTANDCVPWTKYDEKLKNCVCKSKEFFGGILKCIDSEASQDLYVIDCHCMTYNTEKNSIEVGACIENCFNTDRKLHDKLYNVKFSSKNLSKVNDIMCSQPHDKPRQRCGRLCGACKQGYYLQAYSYNITCVNCTEGNTNLWKYFAISLAPLTIFYFLVLFFKLNTTLIKVISTTLSRFSSK